MTPHEATDIRASATNTPLPAQVELLMRSRNVRGAEASGTAPPCSCNSRAKNRLPSVRKPPSGTSACAPLGQRLPGGGPPDFLPNCITVCNSCQTYVMIELLAFCDAPVP